jgi:hypothetical protein
MLANPPSGPAGRSPGTWQVCSAATDRAGWHSFLSTFFGYWLSICPGTGLLPGRQHFDPVEIGPVMSRVWLLDVVRDGGAVRLRYRLVGTKEVDTLQREVTGQWFDDVHPRFKENPAHLERFVFMATKGLPTYRKGTVNFAHKREHEQVENCVVPLARDGKTVDILAACSVLYRADGSEI